MPYSTKEKTQTQKTKSLFFLLFYIKNAASQNQLYKKVGFELSKLLFQPRAAFDIRNFFCKSVPGHQLYMLFLSS